MLAALLALAIATPDGPSLGLDRPGPTAPLLVLPPDGPAAPAADLQAELARALRARLGATAVLTTAELAASLSAERTKDVLGCDDVACLNELLGALGGRWALALVVTPGPPVGLVTAILRDLEDAGRSFRIERRVLDLVPGRLGGLAESLADALLLSGGWGEQEAPAAIAGPPPGGLLAVRTEPSGALVRVDGRDVGQTPLELAGLTAGTYTVEVRRRGYELDRRELRVPEAGRASLELGLVEHRDWTAMIYFGAGVRSATPVGGAERASFELLEGGLEYGRELYGPLRVGGLAGWQLARFSEEGVGAAALHGVAVGGFVDFGGCLCMRNVARLASQYASTPEERASAEAFLAADSSQDFALISGHLRAALMVRSPGFATLELGVRLGMLGVLQVDMLYSALMIGDPRLELDGGLRSGAPDLSGFMVRVGLGYAAFYAEPE